ncbi:hypothetical protein HOD30_01530 [Candidatus Peregrinibacteria bacterium]|jgi:type II secretory pathway pseudopilin PulG|nr:hypothetical protein [Candidatus Peregrinibacteria bacterium]MBT4632215.1 hypothetical protein [Candidatus Peregrinibacteria bacterium]MBT5516310.1 hypothetical protein [Candidatus Peregrinibacteria bacterium]MBT5824374.1 hypothetical protein [Candidatus Peregrinibacteria bacterium]
MKYKAFSFLEFTIAIAVLLIIITYTVPKMANYMFSNQLEVAGEGVIHVLRKAQAQSATQVNDEIWQVDFDEVAGTYTFGSSDEATYDIVYTLPGTVSFTDVTLTGAGDVVIFDQLTGASATDGTIELTGSDGSTYSISINTKGHVDKS